MTVLAGSLDDLTTIGPPLRTMAVADVEALAEELGAYHAHFAPLFQRAEQRHWAAVYLRGLLTTDVPRKNIEAMALRLLGAGPGAERQVRALQQFIGEGRWDDAAMWSCLSYSALRQVSCFSRAIDSGSHPLPPPAHHCLWNLALLRYLSRA